MDEYVTSARSHWGPRFTANGVPAADFDRVVAGLQSWDDWCSAWSGAASVHEDLGLEALADDRLRSAGAHLSTAAVVYHFAKFVFVRDLEQMQAAHQAAVRCLDAALPHLDPPGERIEMPFDGATMYGILRKPVGSSPHPVVICVPGLDSTKEELRATEQLFLERGLATFSVDGPGQGEAEYDLPIRPDWEVPGRVFVDTLVARDDIDADHIGVWGVSLGGYYAPRFASGDERIKACVSLCGPYSFGENWDALPALTRETFIVRSRSSNDDDARALALTLTMSGRTSSLRCPTLVVAGKKDRLIPWQQAERLHHEVDGSHFLALEDGNHGCANVLAAHRYRTADWMAVRLGG
ncbi:alpha/beta hydrolase [Mycolicibacterium sp. P9-64]|uniref:alpha/beta hydrolase family protein n=1 Tax=Mycolicibacterium sp. P9-64 TaxID=2024612 RepID=UPI0011EEF9B5|nr:alpha/beta hydrolase [Mycolicibacterium sp. P9-64]KAA0079439.1 alpha/beta hydrolase [Mycolicibacterium sp. P9-64]